MLLSRLSSRSIPRRTFTLVRYQSTESTTPPTAVDYELIKAKAKSDWKRRQEGSNFIDTLNLTVVSGKGGAGGVAFHREKFKARGPPSGGAGGPGGSVYLVATPTVTSLAHLPRTIRGGSGAPGGGKWLAGRRGEDVVVRVPIGTVVREVKWEAKGEEEAEREVEDRRDLEWAWEVNKTRLHEAEARERRWSAWKKRRDHYEKFGAKAGEAEVEPWRELDEVEFDADKMQALESFRRALFTMYPQTELAGHPSFLATEHHLLSKMLSREVELPGKKLRRRRRRRHGRDGRLGEEEPLLSLDLTEPTPANEPILLVSGGLPGLGNPSFLTHEDRSPKYATKGGEGEMMRLELEVKSTGEVGLVGLPNAGKSTLLRALTSSTPRVASFAFTTLNPHLGTCVLYTDGTFSGPRGTTTASTLIDSTTDISDTPSTPEYFSATSLSESSSTASSSSFDDRSSSFKGRTEELRFTITDNPGLLAQSHLNHGLGHSFLRHIERCTTLVYVIDLEQDPVRAIETLRNELTEYEKVKGLSEGELTKRVKGVVVNKADLFGPDNAQASSKVSETEEEHSVGRTGEEEGGESRRSTAEEGRAKLQQIVSLVRSIEEGEVSRGVREEGESIWVVPVSAKRRENVQALVQRLASSVKLARERKKFDEEEELRLIEEEKEGEEFERWIR